MAGQYNEIYARWRRDPEAFWAETAKNTDWVTQPKTTFDPDAGVYGRWFTDGVTNACWNAVDRHIEGGRGAQAALIYDSAMTGAQETYSYTELRDEVSALSASLLDMGVLQGDRVIIYMPMIPQAVFAMLACARIGAVHSVTTPPRKSSCPPHAG